MSKRKPGEWWHKSLNVVTGCTPAGAGCDHCWAKGLVRRFPVARGGRSISNPDFSHIVCHGEKLNQPERRSVQTIYAVSLLGDLFHEQVSSEFIRDVLRVIHLNSRHLYVILTKRPARVAQVWDWAQYACPTVIVMASVWDQESANAACAEFADAPFRWGLHMEPLLDHVVVANAWGEYRTGQRGPRPSWVVVGGENGPGARPCYPAWISDIADQCRLSGIPFWYKGPGTWSCQTAPELPREYPW